ncbi:type II toxin-antitoxin system Phd/YefM family antitoxin [cf. Phormidesmis sp. LEGE 11477]|uniref:type II toxin-antitoxin system Phd/YefM family antitoxin n=1 Tax=cf. Phormidesmis sp. LEGE 11477 TaxID=1828680 RepID=UPI0018801B97|nr:type II toxin-antitoxin system Phd/YefM family antitoxin [cf. Phormidesmis sp. LEGE 11477]MBE9064306.1 type II toxin-antitoxin system Phd/YefM family antitoxin [cf. Phormidesmis sp. LEGE 11477]
MTEKIGIREFRQNIGTYVDSTETIAISRHGQTVGYFVPVHKKPSRADVEAFMTAALKVEDLLSEHGIDEEEMVAEFEKMRKNKA